MDLHINSTNHRTIKESFFKIAKQILNQYILVVNKKEYRVVTIEFYYYNEDVHKDTHSHAYKRKRAKEMHVHSSKWYLHYLNTQDSTRFKRKGIDYTFGDGTNYGGILIKEVRELYGDKLLHTQSIFIDELVKELNPAEVDKCNSIIFQKMIEEDNRLNFEARQDLEEKNILTWTRKGLSKKENEFSKKAYAFKLEDF